MPNPSDKEGSTVASYLKQKKTSKLKLFLKKLFTRTKPSVIESTTVIDSMLHESEEDITSNIGVFTEKTVEEVMIPRSDIISINVDSTLEELSEVIIQHAHTRTLVYKERLDNIIGFVHIKDLFEIIANSKEFNLKSLLRKHIISPHSMKLIDLLTQMQMNRTHIAVIVDEYGGTDGIVTIEDIIEEIVGRIDDEHDLTTEDNSYKILKPGLIVTSSRVEIEELEAILGVKLKKSNDEFDTIGGLLMAKTGNVPEKGEVINITDDVVAEILEATPRTIKQIKITYIT